MDDEIISCKIKQVIKIMNFELTQVYVPGVNTLEFIYISFVLIV